MEPIGRKSRSQMRNDSEVMELLELIEEWEVHGYFELLKLCELKKPKLLPVAAKATTYCREVIWSYWQFENGTRSSKTN